MTVAAGFVCQYGIVVCADSQESAGDYKFPVEKLLTRSDAWTEIAIAGSGIGPLVDMATHRIAHRIMGGLDGYGVIEEIIREELCKLYETEFRLYPGTDEEKIIELLLAVKLTERSPDFPILLHATATAVSGNLLAKNS